MNSMGSGAGRNDARRVAKTLRILSGASAVAAFASPAILLVGNVTQNIVMPQGISGAPLSGPLDKASGIAATGVQGIASAAACLCLFGLAWFVAGYFARVLETGALARRR